MQKSGDLKYWSEPLKDVLDHFSSDTDGLTSEEADIRLKKNGENLIKEQKKTSQLMILLNQFNNPIIIILLIATSIAGATGEWIDSAIIFLIIIASAVLSFFQEYSASNAIEELREKVQVKSVVLRDKKEIEIPSKMLVAGDIVKLSTGSLVPADGLIIESFGFFVNQSILTGESLPIEKTAGRVEAEASTEERTNCVFMGTNVANGSATILVTETGENTEFGEIAKQLSLRPQRTEFERGVRHFGYLLTQIMLILTLAVFAINVIFQRPAIDSLLFSVALAVGITPQLLPAIISITLSKGSRVMAGEGVIVRRLNAIENFGSMDVLCTDKTGTMTEGVIRIDGAVDVDGQDSDIVFRLAYLNAFLQTGMENSLDDTIVGTKNIDVSDVTKISEIPFDFTRARLGVIVKEADQEYSLIVKGALKNILSICSYTFIGGEISEIKDDIMSDIMKRFTDWSNHGIRVIGVAKKQIQKKEKYTVEDESDMVFMGFLLLFDHPKEDVSKTIEELADKGVSLRVITGDNKLIAIHTAEAVGLNVTGVITGAELMKMSEESLWSKIENVNLFAEVDPNQKERIILALKKMRHVVGYMGDGINDVPALHAADVSISVNNAVDVAKESADLVLVEKSFEVLNRGIELGRTTFANTLKYILVTTSANFGNMFSMAGISLFLPFLPLLPKQILLLNFLSDFPAITIANDIVDVETLQRPRRWNIKLIRDFMFTFGFVSSVFDYITFAVLLIGFRVEEELFQTCWFTLSMFTELLILLVMRTHKPFFRSRPAPLLLRSCIIMGMITIALPYLPLSRMIDLVPVSMPIMAALVGIATMYIIITEIAKKYFYRIKSHM